MSDSKLVRFFTFAQWHNKKQVGSTDIRAKNLIKYWDNAELYLYGEKPDVMVFQKVYTAPDYDLPKTLKAIKILDICDPDWLDSAPIKETVDAMTAVVVPTKSLKDFIEQLTDKPVRIIKDRFDLAEFPSKPKTHKGRAKKVVWFGYSHNAELLKSAIKSIIDLGLELTVVSNSDPNVLSWAESLNLAKDKYKYIAYDKETINAELAKYDIAILPAGLRPRDRFKSENKEIIANLCGLPVVKNRDDLEALIDPKVRQVKAEEAYNKAVKEYDVNLSIKEYKDLINEVS